MQRFREREKLAKLAWCCHHSESQNRLPAISRGSIWNYTTTLSWGTQDSQEGKSGEQTDTLLVRRGVRTCTTATATRFMHGLNLRGYRGLLFADVPYFSTGLYLKTRLGIRGGTNMYSYCPWRIERLEILRLPNFI